MAAVSKDPTLTSLAANVSHTGLALGVEGIEVLLESMVGRDARIDRASPGGRRGGRACGRSSPHGTTSLSLPTPDIPACSVGAIVAVERAISLAPLSPKNLGPFQWPPVIAPATLERLR